MLKRKFYFMDAATESDAGGGTALDVGTETTDTSTQVVDNKSVDTKSTVDVSTSKTAVTTETKTADVKAIWPEDWRTHLSKGDEKVLKQLGRYASPQDVWDKARALEQRLSSGELKSVLPKDAKPEELAQWRKENGIPEAADKYNLKLDNNLVIGEEDKPLVDEFLKSAHANNMTENQAKAAVQTYFDIQAKNAEIRAAKDETERVATLDALNGEWGSGFRANVNMVNGLLSRFPATVQESLKSARMPDGTAIFNNPEVLRGFVALALEVNPAGTLVPSGTGDVAKGVEEQIASIEKTMKENRSAYNKDETMQAKYRELIGARETLKARKAA